MRGGAHQVPQVSQNSQVWKMQEGIQQVADDPKNCQC